MRARRTRMWTHRFPTAAVVCCVSAALLTGCDTYSGEGKEVARELDARVFVTQKTSGACWMHIRFANGHTYDIDAWQSVCALQKGKGEK